MNDPRWQDLDPVTAELLLGGGADEVAQRWATNSADADLQTLAAALAWASAPAMEHELAGEEAAVVAFREARTARAAGSTRVRAPADAVDRAEPVSPPRSLSLRWRLAGSALLTATLTAAAVAGLALAGNPLSTPGPAPLVSQDTTAQQEISSSGSARLAPSAQPSATVEPTITPAATADPALTALCRSYFDTTRNDRSKALKKARFAPLIEAAGGAERVDAYCITSLGLPPTPPLNSKQK